MKTKAVLKCSLKFSIVLLIVVFISLTGCSKESGAKSPENQSQQTGKKDTTNTSIIRDNDVNVSSLDLDKDGNLYQCEMDYDVISDKPGTCPKCGMELKKVSIADAKKNLDAYNN
ncbi:MAG: heavy metal-binding domain-containing protein [Ignavibacteriaceae bacterium]|nr:heavy metal-binding domain-containing protein [Ignavibacteriaceae bacterium]